MTDDEAVDGFPLYQQMANALKACAESEAESP